MILNGTSSATGLRRPHIPGAEMAVCINDEDVQLPDMGLSARADCPPEYAGFVFYSLEDKREGGGRTLPDAEAFGLSQKLRKLRKNCKLVPYMIAGAEPSWYHGWPVMAPVPRPAPATSSQKDHLRFIRDTGGGVAFEIYPGEYTPTPESMYEYARRITAAAVGALHTGLPWYKKLAAWFGWAEKPCPAWPAVWWCRVGPMYDHPGAPLTEAETKNINAGIAAGGGSGIVWTGWFTDEAKVLVCERWAASRPVA